MENQKGNFCLNTSEPSDTNCTSVFKNAISKLIRDSDSKQKMVDGISRLIEQLKKEPIESQKVIEELEKIRFYGL